MPASGRIAMVTELSSTLTGVSFLILGGGGHGRVVADLVRAQGALVWGYADTDPQKLDEVVEPGGGRVAFTQEDFLRYVESYRRYPDGVDAVALGVGHNHQRWELFARLAPLPMPPLKHPHSVVSPSARVGSGTVIIPGSVINANAEIGAATIINTGATVGHDCVVGDTVHIAPGANICGGVHIGPRTWVGTGAVVIPGVRIGFDVMIGAGTVVVRDVPDGVTVVGNPGRILRQPGIQ